LDKCIILFEIVSTSNEREKTKCEEKFFHKKINNINVYLTGLSIDEENHIAREETSKDAKISSRKYHIVYNANHMQFRSKSSFQTLKTVPSGSENRATGLLTQAGYIRQEMAGVYNYLPLGLKVLRKIETIIREEMD